MDIAERLLLDTRTARCVALAAILLISQGAVPAAAREHRAVLFPFIDTPPIRTRETPAPLLGELPKDARAALPARDFGQIFVALPVQPLDGPLSSERVRAEVVLPVLRAVGFAAPGAGFQDAPGGGIDQGRPRLDLLSRWLAAAYDDRRNVAPPLALDLLDASLRRKPPGEDVDRRLQLVRGMNFDLYKADVEHPEIIYPFLQLHEGVPIEHTLLLATRRAGQSVSSVRGTVLHHYRVENHKPPAGLSARQAYRALARVKGVDWVEEQTVAAPTLVLLPYGNTPVDPAISPERQPATIALRHAWRAILHGGALGQRVPFLTWLDAQTGEILKLIPLVSAVKGEGQGWRRDPGSGTIVPRSFEVDASFGGRYTLQLEDVANRIDLAGNGDDPGDLSISDSGSGSTLTLADFRQPSIADGASAVCASGRNTRFQQVHLFALIHAYHTIATGLGIYLPFPVSAWSPSVETAGIGCAAFSGFILGACRGYYEPTCPNFSAVGLADEESYTNLAHDNTIVAHEFAHSAVLRLTDHRPPTWCGHPDCPMPVGLGRLHDLADAWADHLEDTNCTGGWVAKNVGGVDASLNCTGPNGHAEDSGLPRLHELPTPFDSTHPGDHFPEHRVTDPSGGYADMQIAAAALWQVREGLRSLEPVSGHVQYFVRLTRALRYVGFLGSDPGDTDLGVYRLLHDLEVELINQWALPGSGSGTPGGDQSVNKVLAGFAKAGLFPLPEACIDGDLATADARFCPQGEAGGDAIVDIVDNEPGDDPVVDGVVHPENDYLRLGGPAPTFQVWTGPRYRFNGSSALPIAGAAPCNTSFQVEVSADAGFLPGATVKSPLQNVVTDAAKDAACFGTWSPDADQWTTLQSGGPDTRLYYRATTLDAFGTAKRLSTSPGAGLWQVPPPFAMLTTSGRP